MFKKLLLPLGILSSLVSSALAGPTIVPVTNASGVKTFQPTDIIQIVGAVATTNTHGSMGILRITFLDGTGIDNGLSHNHFVGTFPSSNYSTPLQGMTLTGISSLQITYGTGAVMVKVMKTAEEFVSEPVMLPVVDDGKYTITLETSVDMQNWAPAAPGDYLGSTSHRFFRVRAEKKDGPVSGE